MFALLADALRLSSEPTQPAHTHTHTLSTKVSTFPSVVFAKSRLEVDMSQLSSHNAIWNVDPCVYVSQEAFILL